MGIKDTLVINFFGGPGARKTTMAESVSSELKWMGYECELATEYAKYKVWEESHDVLRDQMYISAKQHHGIFILNKKVDFIVTDSPILLGACYAQLYNVPNVFVESVIEFYQQYNNLNFFLERPELYIEKGRMQSKDEAIEIDKVVLDMLAKHSDGFEKIEAKKENISKIVDIILKYKI